MAVKQRNYLSRPLMMAVMLAVVGLVAADGETTACTKFTPHGEPVPATLGLKTAPTLNIVCHTGQLVSFNPDHNVSDWPAYRLRREDLLNRVVDRKDSFRGDPKVEKEHRVVPDDYTNTGFDRGHLAPAAAMLWSGESMRDSFLMTNIAPQVGSGFNQHIWKSLEQRMRQWACDRGTLYVVTGPLYETRPIGKLINDQDGDGLDDNGVIVDVPSHFFKLALDPLRVEAIAFVLPNQKLKTADLPKYLTSIADIEARSKLDFLTGLSDRVENVVESHVQPQLWDRPDDVRCAKLK